jgi:enoyl-CoA hydratase/carnithine racemase
LAQDIYLEQTHAASATLVINRPDKRNAITVAMWAEIPALMSKAANDPDVKLVFVRGQGGAFASGADIAEMPQIYATKGAALANDEQIQGAMSAIENCPKPVIALIEGPCVGGGCGLALACDMRIGAVGSRYGVTPAKLGLVYGAADTRRLVQAVGLSKAKDILFTGRLLAAEEAHAIGLIDRLVAPDELARVGEDLATQIGAASQFSIRGQKEILAMLRTGRDEDPRSRDLFGASFEGEDFQEGYAAFMQKRAPRFPVR